MPSPTPHRVLVATRAHEGIVAALRTLRPDLEYRGAALTDVTPDDLAWADVFVGFERPPGAATMGRVRWVHSTGAGVDAWLVPPNLDASILLTRTPESFGPVIAEWAVARILAFQQQLGALADAQRNRQWAPRAIARVAGTRALVVGTGDVGGAVARALHRLGVQVTGVSRTGIAPNNAPGNAQDHASPFSATHRVEALAGLVGDAHWIVLAIPETASSRGLVSRDVLSRCRSAVLLNAGRGAVLDESALPEALDRGWLRGAALDVFAEEPLPPSSPLWSDPRVMISPHCSGRTTVDGAVSGFLECLAAVERGETPRWAVDRARGY